MKVNDQNISYLESIEKKNIFLMPDNYFESLDNRIENRIVELNASCKKYVFEVPEAYFEQSAISINQKINRECILDDPELKESVFKVPEGYLVSMEDETKAKILPEMKIKENHFAIPKDYFVTLSDKIQDKIGEKDNVIRFDFASSTVVRYSMAASVALVLVASALFYVARNQEQTVAIETKSDDQLAKVLLASLDKSEVKLYLEKQNEDVETHELMEFTSDKKKGKIKLDFEKEIISTNISEAEKQAIELEMNDLDVSELESDI